jgi:D-arabinose 1-dehydrogenase-like Zn-dependent alcohol dehydrogenase
VEVGGPATLEQSFAAIKLGGIISIVGILAGEGKIQPSVLEILKHGCIVRGILIGNRSQFEEMNRFIDVNGIKPVLDPEVWKLEELKEAYKYLVSVEYH